LFRWLFFPYRISPTFSSSLQPLSYVQLGRDQSGELKTGEWGLAVGMHTSLTSSQFAGDRVEERFEEMNPPGPCNKKNLVSRLLRSLSIFIGVIVIWSNVDVL